jgi:predicted LPLAT superfamily acyltransferase
MTPIWAQNRERGTLFGIRILARLLRLLGRRTCLVAVTPVVAYFFLTGSGPRRASRDFRRRAKAMGAKVGTGFWAGFYHAMTFAAAAVDRFSAWNGDYGFDNVGGLDEPVCGHFRDSPDGAVVLVSHVGSFDVLRAIGSRGRRRRVIAITHSGNAANYARALAAAAPESQLELLEVDDLDIATAMQLSDAVDHGAWVVIAADRLPPTNAGREIVVPFLGSPARFPQGPFLMVAALRCPVYALFCIRQSGSFHVHVERLAEQLILTRGKRDLALSDACCTFAAILEKRAIATPYQWYNFFDFWAENDNHAAERAA